MLTLMTDEQWYSFIRLKLHVNLVEYAKESRLFKKLFERSLLVCQYHRNMTKHSRDVAYNFIRIVSAKFSNISSVCPMPPGLYSLSNYRFDSNSLPPLLQVTGRNVTLKVDYCTGKKWTQANRSCFVSAVIRLRFLDWMK